MRISLSISCPFCNLIFGADRSQPNKAVLMLADPVGEVERGIDQLVGGVVEEAKDHIKLCKAGKR